MNAYDRLSEIQARSTAATDGPWNTGAWRDRGFVHHTTIEPRHGARTIGDITDNHEGNAEFIAYARTDVPALVAALQAVLDYVDETDVPDLRSYEIRDLIADRIGVPQP